MTTHTVFSRMRIRDWLGLTALVMPSLSIVLFVAAALTDGTSLWSAIGWYAWLLLGTVPMGMVLLVVVHLMGWVWDRRTRPTRTHRYASGPFEAQDEVSQ